MGFFKQTLDNLLPDNGILGFGRRTQIRPGIFNLGGGSQLGVTDTFTQSPILQAAADMRSRAASSIDLYVVDGTEDSEPEIYDDESYSFIRWLQDIDLAQVLYSIMYDLYMEGRAYLVIDDLNNGRDLTSENGANKVQFTRMRRVPARYVTVQYTGGSLANRAVSHYMIGGIEYAPQQVVEFVDYRGVGAIQRLKYPLSVEQNLMRYYNNRWNNVRKPIFLYQDGWLDDQSEETYEDFTKDVTTRLSPNDSGDSANIFVTGMKSDLKVVACLLYTSPSPRD